MLAADKATNPCYKLLMAVLAKIPVRITVDEFLKWDSGDERRYELVDGEPRAMAPTSTVHGFLQSELARLIGNHLREAAPECEVVTNPGIVPRLLSEHNVRIPDLAVTCSPLAAGQATLADLVLLIEILSPSNQAKTWTNVWAYTSIASAQEILVLRADRISAELLRHSSQGEWPERPIAIAEGDLVLESIDFRVAIADLYERTGLQRPLGSTTRWRRLDPDPIPTYPLSIPGRAASHRGIAEAIRRSLMRILPPLLESVPIG